MFSPVRIYKGHPDQGGTVVDGVSPKDLSGRHWKRFNVDPDRPAHQNTCKTCDKEFYSNSKWALFCLPCTPYHGISRPDLEWGQHKNRNERRYRKKR